MKRFNVIIILLAINCCFLNAQNIEFGIKAGPSYSKYAPGNDYSSSILGFHGGAFGRFKFNRYFSTQPEILYAQKGGSFTVRNANNQDEKVRSKFSYITIPLVLVFTPTPDIDIHFGPEFGFLMKMELKSETSPTIDATDFYNDLDKSLVFGGGYRFENGMRVTIRYIAGFKY